MNNIFIPKKINIGFQNREDTYTKKLAYVIYFDNKGILRKETSWNSWRDKKIDNIEYDNTPIEGFVLNKKVGDYRSDWNHRHAYVRIYDPRDFEFEITIENLLYILENTNSIKGKGLEGEFVYGWCGKDLLLIPISSPDYQDLKQFNEVVHSNKIIKAKDLKIGGTYLTKQNEHWIYMGKFPYYDYYKTKKKDHFWFYNNDHFKQIISLSNKIIDIIDEKCISNYAELFDKLECNQDYSPYDETKDEYKPYEFEEFKNHILSNKYYWGLCYYDYTHNEIQLQKCNQNNVSYFIGRKISNSYNYSYNEFEKIERTIEEIFDIIHPHYKLTYLANGKFYKRER